jgi:hypothetical protein
VLNHHPSPLYRWIRTQLCPFTLFLDSARPPPPQHTHTSATNQGMCKKPSTQTPADQSLRRGHSSLLITSHEGASVAVAGMSTTMSTAVVKDSTTVSTTTAAAAATTDLLPSDPTPPLEPSGKRSSRRQCKKPLGFFEGDDAALTQQFAFSEDGRGQQRRRQRQRDKQPCAGKAQQPPKLSIVPSRRGRNSHGVVWIGDDGAEEEEKDESADTELSKAFMEHARKMADTSKSAWLSFCDA